MEKFTRSQNSNKEQVVTPLYERPLHPQGAVYSLDDEDHWDGETYRLNGVRYILVKKNGKVIIYIDEKGDEITDPATIKLVLNAAKENEEIREARKNHAIELAQGDQDLQEILEWHMEYSNGPINPFEEDGITFYQVGRNSSHEFYAGIKDGKKYRLTVGESGLEDEDGEVLFESKISEVDEWDYMGHY